MLGPFRSWKGERYTHVGPFACTHRPCNKNFSICWTNTNPVTDTSGQVMLDGIQAGGYFCNNGLTREWVCSDCYVSSTTIRKFCFSPITFTGLHCPYIHWQSFYLVIQTTTIISALHRQTLERLNSRFGLLWILSPALTSNAWRIQWLRLMRWYTSVQRK